MVIKRIVAGVICLALFIGALAVGTKQEGVSVGRGDGEDVEVTSLDELSNVLQTLESGTEDMMPASLAARAGADRAYESLTVVEKTSALIDNSYNDSYNDITVSGSSYLSFNRELTLAYTEDAAYYRSKGSLISSSRSVRTDRTDGYSDRTERTVKTGITQNFDVEIYIDGSGASEKVYIMAHEISYSYYREEQYTDYGDTSNNESESDHEGDDALMRVLNNHLDEWVDISDIPMFAETFLEVDDANIQSLSSIGEMIEDTVEGENDDFIAEGDLYTLREEAFLRLFGVEEEDADQIGGTYLIDLSKSTEPAIVIEMNGSGGSIEENFSIKNINNTMINVRTATDGAIDITDYIDEEDL